jgi:hypothetical protein
LSGLGTESWTAFLGAGVSIESKIPSWPQLADAVLEQSGESLG